MPIQPPKRMVPQPSADIDITLEDNSIEELPLEIQHEIWEYLDNRSLITLAATNHQIRQDIQDRGILSQRYVQYHQQMPTQPFVPQGADAAWQQFVTHEQRLDLFRASLRYKSGILHDTQNDVIDDIQIAQGNCLYVAWIAENGLYFWDPRLRNEPIKKLFQSSRLLRALKFSEDGKKLAVSDDLGHILLWDLEDPEQEFAQWQTHQSDITSLVFSNGRIVSSANDNTLKIWPLDASENHPTTLHVSAPPLQVFFQNQGRNLVVLCQDKTLQSWDLSHTPPTSTALSTGETDILGPAIVSENLRYMASVSDDGELRVSDLHAQGEHEQTTLGHRDAIRDMVFTTDSRHLITASADETIKIWRLRDFPAVSQTLIGHRDAVNALCPTSASKYLLSASDDGCVRVWDLSHALLECTQIFSGHTHDTISDSHVTGDRRFVVQRATNAATLRVLDRHRNTSIGLDLTRHQIPRVHRFTVASTQNTLVTTFEKVAYFWDLDNLSAPSKILTQERGNIVKSVFSPNDHFFATVSSDHAVRIWSMQQDKLQCHTFEDMPFATEISFSSDSHFLTVWASTEAQIHAIDLRSEIPRVLNLPDYHYGFTHPYFSPDSSSFVAQARDGTTLIWDMQQSPPICVNKMSHKSSIRHLAFAKDSSFYVAALKHSNHIEVFGRDHQHLESLSLHDQSNHVTGMDICSSNRFVAATTSSERIVVWDMHSKKRRMLELSQHHDSIKKIRFIPKESIFISASWDQTVRVWDLRQFPAVTCQSIDVGVDPIRDFSYLAEERSLLITTSRGTTMTWKLDF